MCLTSGPPPSPPPDVRFESLDACKMNETKRQRTARFTQHAKLDLRTRQALRNLRQLSLCKLGLGVRHLLIEHGHLELLLDVEQPGLGELGELLDVGELAAGGDELGLLRGELGLELGPEGDEGFGVGEAGFEFADASGIVGAFGFGDADPGSEFLEFGVVLGGGWLLLLLRYLEGLDGKLSERNAVCGWMPVACTWVGLVVGDGSGRTGDFGLVTDRKEARSMGIFGCCGGGGGGESADRAVLTRRRGEAALDGCTLGDTDDDGSAGDSRLRIESADGLGGAVPS